MKTVMVMMKVMKIRIKNNNDDADYNKHENNKDDSDRDDKNNNDDYHNEDKDDKNK